MIQMMFMCVIQVGGRAKVTYKIEYLFVIERIALCRKPPCELNNFVF